MPERHTILRSITSNQTGLDKDDNLLVKGRKMIFDHLGTQKTLEVIAGVLYVDGVSIAIGASDGFDNTGTGLVATTKTAAIVELKALIDAINAILS